MNKTILNLILFSLINLIILPRSLSASISESQPNAQKPPAKFKQPKPPSDAPKVGRGQGGASRSARGTNRGECYINNSTSKVTITPLLPSNGWGLTVSESPTLWISVTYSGDRLPEEAPLTAELSVEDRQTDTKLEPKIYSLELPQTSGIVGIVLPHILESGHWYRWYLVNNCQAIASKREDIVQIAGFLQRKELNDVIYRSKSLSPAGRISAYTEQHIWHDAFHEAVLLYCHNQSDNELNNYWQTLLKSDAVNLGKYGDLPVFCPNEN